MKSQGYGRIVNLSSTAGKSVSTLGGAHYTASKAGLLGLTRAAAKELGPFGITVNAVCPGLIDTELTREHATPGDLAAYARSFPIPRLGTATEVADLICFLASEPAGYITGVSRHQRRGFDDLSRRSQAIRDPRAPAARGGKVQIHAVVRAEHLDE